MWGVAFFRWLNVRKEERWLVAKLFWVQFFQGAGVAFFFTSALATFLTKHDPSEDLPIVYICSSFLLLLTGYVYGKLEHRYSVTRFSRYAIIFMAGSIFLLFLIEHSSLINIPGFDYFLPVWYNVLYLISGLEFWGIAATVFEVRQSKRLFSIISSGEIPAKFIGYSLASGFVAYVGTANLLIPAFVCMLLSLPFLKQIKKTGVLHINHFHDEAHGHQHTSEKKLKTFLKRFTSHGLIYRVALLSFIMSVCLVCANFAFYSRIKEEFHSDKEFAEFIGIFMAVVRICALLVKLLLTSKIVSRLGIKKSLLLTPFIFILLIVLVIVLQHTMQTELSVLYTFGITCIVLDVLKTALNTPVFLSLMQPLGIHDRLRAHNIVKGIMDPFAYLFSGVFLFLMMKFELRVDLLVLSYCLLFFAVGWIVSIYFVNKEYYKTILTAVSRKYYLQNGLTVDDDDTRAFINKQLQTGATTEVLQLLQLLQLQSGNIIRQDVAEQLLRESPDAVKEGILKLLLAGRVTIADKYVILIAADKNANLGLRLLAFSWLNESQRHEDELAKYTEDDIYEINILCNAALLRDKTSPYYFQSSNLLDNLVNSDSKINRIKAAHIIGKAANTDWSGELVNLVNDKVNEVKSAAILAAGELKDEILIPEILKHIKTNRAEVAESIYRSGSIAVPFVVAFILGSTTSYEEKNQLIAICARAGGEVAKSNLIDLLHHLPNHSHNILRAVYNCKGGTNPKQFELFEDFAQRKLGDAAEILFMQKFLSRKTDAYHLLSAALDIELLSLRESLLYIFAMIYNEEEIEKVRRAIKLNNRESFANALELIEMTVPKKFAHDFTVIFEHGDLEQRCSVLHIRRGSHINDISHITDTILRDSDYEFNQWTKSCTIYLSIKEPDSTDHILVKRYILSEHPVLKQTANFTLTHHMENKLLLLEKVLMLKKTAIFAETPESVLADLAPLMQEVVYTEGSSIFEEGAIGDSMFILYQGKVRIHKGNTTLVVLSKENEVFGELSLFDAETRSASATAQTDCVLYKLEQLPFFELIEVRPEIVMGAIKILSKRLRDQNEKLVQMSNK